MLRLISAFQEKPLLSLQTGGSIGTIKQPIIDPNNLRVVGFRVAAGRDTGSILLTDDIREISTMGVIIDRFDVLSDPEDLVRYEAILKLSFKLLDKSVVTETGKKMGKVSDFAVEDVTFYTEKLYVRQPVLKSFTGGELVIERREVVEVTDSQIVIHDLDTTVKSPAAQVVPGN